jgi:hypothetical protein
MRLWIALLPLIKPTTCDTAYFGGIEIMTLEWATVDLANADRLGTSQD